MTTIIVVGGADTGRAPLAAALLRRRLSEHAGDWRIESAGVLGHDGDTWQPETRLALDHLNITPHDHVARSLTPEIAATADLLITVDRGTGRALELHFPNALWRALPDLANTPREVPDPFRMTFDAWIIYGRELDGQIKAALPTIMQIIEEGGRMKDEGGNRDRGSGIGDQESGIGNQESGIGGRESGVGDQELANDSYGVPAVPAAPPAALPAAAVPAAPSTFSQQLAADRLAVLVRGIAGIPEVVDWARARNAIRETLQVLASSVATANDPMDFRPGAVAMVLGVLGGSDAPLNAGQLAILSAAVDGLGMPLDGAKLGTLAAAIGRWQQ